MKNNAIIITLAYPETIVRVSDEWFLPYLYLFGIGAKNYVRAGHAALVLIDKSTGVLEYYDFGRYIVPRPYGRVRNKITDHELDFPIITKFENNTISNLDEILSFLAMHPKLTHGNGKMIASVCDKVNYSKARMFIDNLHNQGMVEYSAFGKKGTNCSRFVTDALIEGITDEIIKNKLKKSKWFTPSTIGNVLLADTRNEVLEVSEKGILSPFKSTKHKENWKLFLDRLHFHQPDFLGNMHPQTNGVHHKNAQWLSGIGAGAWFELHHLGEDLSYRFRRISPYGAIDVDGIYDVSDKTFDSRQSYEFIPYSNCDFFHIKQHGKVFRFDFIKRTEESVSTLILNREYSI